MRKRDLFIITSCSNRKRATASGVVGIHSIPRDSTANVAKRWMKNVRAARHTKTATELYVGRGFAQAMECKALVCGRLFVVSAGLGLIEGDAQVPNYDLTISPSSSNIERRIIKGEFSCRTWWAEISKLGTQIRGISGLISAYPASLLFIALPRTYVNMVAEDLGSIGPRLAEHIRLFSSEGARHLLPPALQPTLMPYDSRLDGPDSPLPGTKADFAQRAMHHFLKNIYPHLSNDPAQDARAVLRLLRRLRPPVRPNRKRMSDPEVTAVMRKHFKKVDGQSSQMLIYLRQNLGIACEQKRFTKLFRDLKNSLRNH